MHKYERVLDALSATVDESPPGTRIPTEKELAEKFEVSTMTVRRALQILTEGGRLRGVPGRGTFVARPRVTKLVSASSSFSDAMLASGRRPSSQLVEAALRPATSEEAELFEISETHFVVVIRRVRLGDGVPIGYESATLNAAVLPGILGHDLRESLYETMRRDYDIEIERTGLVVSARMPSHDEAELLQMPHNTSCLQTVVTSRVRDADMLERTISVFRGDMYEVAV
jgi:GntR family transcriptional regulator